MSKDGDSAMHPLVGPLPVDEGEVPGSWNACLITQTASSGFEFSIMMQDPFLLCYRVNMCSNGFFSPLPLHSPSSLIGS